MKIDIHSSNQHIYAPLTNGIDFVVFWKEDDKWNCEAFSLSESENISGEDWGTIHALNRITETDNRAIVRNKPATHYNIGGGIERVVHDHDTLPDTHKSLLRNFYGVDMGGYKWVRNI